MAFAAGNNQPNQYDAKKHGNRPVCSFCHKVGHTVDRCFEKIGYPPNYGRGKAKQFTRSAHAVISEGGLDSTESPCLAPAPSSGFTQSQLDALYTYFQSHAQSQSSQPGPGAGNCAIGVVAHVSSGRLAGDSAHVRSTNPASVFPDFVAGKCALTVESQSVPSRVVRPGSSCIIDTGATDSIVYSTDLLFYCYAVSNVTVSLPTGQHVSVSHIGSAFLTPTLAIKNVLVIPSFTFNLLSVSCLTSQHRCCLTFSHDRCVIQDLRTQKMIGSADLVNVLYQFYPYMNVVASVPSVCSAVVSPLVWHNRLGHSSLSNVHCNDSDLRSIKCHVCPLAKQKRLPFPVSVSRAPAIFDLIHCDIWGLYQVSAFDGYRYFLTLVDDYSRVTWVYMMKLKSEARQLLLNFCALIKT
ncbi:Retrovirus-related Pol polyprotein from transposon RE2 [Linum perenne]